MLQFSAPFFLVVPAAALLLGAWTLLRGQRRSRPVSSLRLWRELTPGVSTARRRWLDPLGLLVLLAAVLAGLALAGPRWVYPSPEPLPVTWGIASTQTTTEAWLQADADRSVLLINGTRQPVTSEALKKGIALPVQPDSAGTIHLEIQTPVARAAATFHRQHSAPPFGLMEISSPDKAMDPMLHRAFAVQAGVRLNDATVFPRVVLVSTSDVSQRDLVDAQLVIALPSATLPGVAPGDHVQLPAPATAPWTPQAVAGASGPAAWPAIVPLEHLHVTAFRQATFDNSWQPAAQIQSPQGVFPFVLIRQSQARSVDGTPVLWVWLASSPTSETDWFKSPGFVVFFAHLQQLALGTPAAPDQWIAELDPSVKHKVPADFRPWLAGAAIVLLAAATCWFVVRAA